MRDYLPIFPLTCLFFESCSCVVWYRCTDFFCLRRSSPVHLIHSFVGRLYLARFALCIFRAYSLWYVSNWYKASWRSSQMNLCVIFKRAIESECEWMTIHWQKERTYSTARERNENAAKDTNGLMAGTLVNMGVGTQTEWTKDKSYDRKKVARKTTLTCTFNNRTKHQLYVCVRVCVAA